MCIATTIALFGAGPVNPFVEAAALWLVFAVMILMLMVLLSAAMKSQAPAAGAGIGLWIGLLFFTGLPLIRDHTRPADGRHDAALRGRDVALLWPLATTALAAAVFLPQRSGSSRAESCSGAGSGRGSSGPPLSRPSPRPTSRRSRRRQRAPG